MKIIFSPTKKMIQDEDLAPKTTPVFLSKTEILLEKLRGMSAEQLQRM